MLSATESLVNASIVCHCQNRGFSGDRGRHLRRRVLQRGPGLHRGHPGAGRAGIATDLTAALAEQAAKTTVGGTDVADADYGPLNNPTQLAGSRASWPGARTTPRW